jgi:hypothetical protein
VQVRTSESVDSKRATDETPIQFTVIRDVSIGGALLLAMIFLSSAGVEGRRLRLLK